MSSKYVITLNPISASKITTNAPRTNNDNIDEESGAVEASTPPFAPLNDNDVSEGAETGANAGAG
jgi:hypothetical protein